MNHDQMISKYIPMTETNCYILLSIAKTPKHGYAIVQYVKLITDNKITLGNGTLYGTISKMEADGLIQIVLDDDRRKVYEITKLGKKILLAEKERIHKLYQNLEGVI